MLEFLIAALIMSIFWVIVGFMFYIIPLLFGAPYEGSGKRKVKDILELAKPKMQRTKSSTSSVAEALNEKEKMVDLGSGDGRIVIAFAKKGFEAHGYEINPLLVLVSKWKTRKLKNVKIYWKSFWKADLGKYDIVVLFQYKTIMNKLKEKLKKELKKSARVVSYHWRFKNWKIVKKKGDVYLYNFNL